MPGWCRVLNASHLQFSHIFREFKDMLATRSSSSSSSWWPPESNGVEQLFQICIISKQFRGTEFVHPLLQFHTEQLQCFSLWFDLQWLSTCIVSIIQWWKASSQWTLSESECFCVWGYNLKYSYFFSTSYSFTTLWFSFQLHLTKQKKLATTPWWQPRSNERNSNFHCRWVWISW